MINRYHVYHMEGVFLYNQVHNQIEAVLAQYEVEINDITKGRGIHICNTDKGTWVLTGFRGTKDKGELLRAYLSALKEIGFMAEQIVANKMGEAVTIDEVTGEGFLLKEYISGSELNVNQVKDLKAAAGLLAQYHNTASRLPVDDSYMHMESDTIILQEKEKHERELVKVKNYIRNRKKKSEFERIYLNAYEPMLQTAREALLLLKKKSEADPCRCFCHCDYNQHNILWTDKGWQIVNFENISYRWCIWDLANFLRKMQEKNNWEPGIGNEILKSYMNVRPLSETECEKLYALLLFPEKFWKVTNHYMNSRKSWISERDIEKLRKVIEQEAQRLRFVEQLFRY